MMKQFIRCVAIGLVAGATGLASAQSWNAFHSLQAASDVQVQALGGNTFRLSLGLSPTIMYQNQLLHIEFVFGFWALAAENGDLAAGGSSQNNWAWDPHGNDVAGWHQPSKQNKLMPGNSYDYQFTTLDASQVESFGLHVSTLETFPGTAGNTGFVKFVPEPGGLAGFCMAILASLAIFRRKR